MGRVGECVYTNERQHTITTLTGVSGERTRRPRLNTRLNMHGTCGKYMMLTLCLSVTYEDDEVQGNPIGGRCHSLKHDVHPSFKAHTRENSHERGGEVCGDEGIVRECEGSGHGLV